MMEGMEGPGAGRVDGSQEARTWRSWAGGLDVLTCAALAGLACLAALMLPEGSVLRLVLGISVLFFVPGYLLIEAAAGPVRSASSRARRSLLAIGMSPATVGLLALATAGLPGGFRAGPIVLLFAVACFGLAGAALWRRRAHVRQTAAQPTLA